MPKLSLLDSYVGVEDRHAFIGVWKTMYTYTTCSCIKEPSHAQFLHPIREERLCIKMLLYANYYTY